MKTLSKLLTVSLLAFGSLHANKEVLLKQPETIRVLVKESLKGALIETRGAYHICEPFSEEVIASSNKADRHWMEIDKSGIRFGNRTIPLSQIALIPQEKSSSLLIDGNQYRGVITVCAVDKGLYFINEVDLEEYVAATLSKRLQEPLPESTLHALTIVERTRAAYAAESQSGQNWHVKAAEVGYDGFGTTLRKIGIEDAVKATRSFVLHSTKEKAPFFGFATDWCADSAGVLAPYQTLFQQKDAFEATSYVSCSFAQKNRPHSTWTFTLNKRELADAIGLDAIEEFQLFVDPKSQKVFRVRISDGENYKDISFVKLQSIFGAEFLQSNDLKVEKQDKKHIYLKGQGEGLGTGLCLFTAKQMSQFGQNAKEILATFYPRATVEKLQALYERARVSLEPVQEPSNELQPISEINPFSDEVDAAENHPTQV